MKSISESVADALRQYIHNDRQKVVWRAAFRWKDDNGVIPNAYDSFPLTSIARDNGWGVIVDCECAGIVECPTNV